MHIANLASHASGLPANPAGTLAMMTGAQNPTTGSTPFGLEEFLSLQPNYSAPVWPDQLFQDRHESA